MVVLGLICRLLWFAVPPLLSEDWARFLWDGVIGASGGNPFEQLPSAISGQSPELFDELNSPDYFTVYPPLAQGVFRLSAWMGTPGNIPAMLLALRGILFLAELATIGLLYFLLPANRKSRVLIYALAPLAIAETVGNVHLEGLAILFILLAVAAMQRYSPGPKHDAIPRKKETAGILITASSLAAAIAVKLHPILLLLLLPFRMGWKRGLITSGLAMVLLVVSFIPFISPVVSSNFTQSLDLYFRTFEFNGSFYPVLRWIAMQWSGHNQIALIGPLLGLCAALAILLLIWLRKPATTQQFLETTFWIAALHQLLATTVHPWYILPLLAWSVFSSYRFGIVWAALVPISYAAYSNGQIHDPVLASVIEYSAVLGWLFIELYREKLNRGGSSTP